jgi:signal transduction histidine kinase
MKLLPSSAYHYNEYWKSIVKYNNWFIKLRFIAFVSLINFILAIKYFFRFDLTDIQLYSFIIVTGFILAYNIFFDRIKDQITNINSKITPIHFSLLQILLDLLSLSILVYFTGGIETPLFMFFIFHMIIGSLILPSSIMYFIAGTMIIFFSSFSLLEYYEIIPHQNVVGLYKYELYNDLNFVIGFLFSFSFVVFVSIFLTSKIVHDLYSRESQLKLALDDLHSAEESKQKYIIAVVHELKSPIAAMISNIELITGNYLGEVPNKIMDKALRAKEMGIEAISNINSILHVSRFKLLNKIHKEEISLERLFASIINKYQDTASRKNIKVRIKSNDSIDKINADEILLDLAFSNIIGNSIKYTPENGNIEVEYKRMNDFILITCSDDGIGIPKNELENIFEEYYRASNAKQNKIEGTGTGLNIVKQIIDKHNGIIAVDSPSKLSSQNRPGVVFTVKLPIE